jgi:hypothetical protein
VHREGRRDESSRGVLDEPHFWRGLVETLE